MFLVPLHQIELVIRQLQPQYCEWGQQKNLFGYGTKKNNMTTSLFNTITVYLKADTVILGLSDGEGDVGSVKEEAVDELAGLLAAVLPVSRRLRPRPARPAPPTRKARATKEKNPKI